MCDYFKLEKERENFMNKLDFLLKDAEDNFETESKAAGDIQRVFRGTRVRGRNLIMNAAASQIARVYRGHLGRKKTKTAFVEKLDRMQYAKFEYYMVQVQKIFRGYYSRRYKRDHAKRKKYLKEIAQKGDEVRQMLQQYAEDLKLREEEEARRAQGEELRKLSENLHHLVGTRQIRGVFNPPPQYMKAPTVGGVPVEDHLRCAVKDLLRTKGIAKSGLVPDLNGSRVIPLKGQKNRLSLQASAPYDSVIQQQSRDRVLHRLLTIDPQHGYFYAGGRTNVMDSQVKPLCDGDPYMDAWSNPVLIRGIPQNQKEFLQSTYSRKSLFSRVPDRPYYLATGGNKSTVLPNDLFDVIQDAEKSGGVTLRHIGTTKRFGLSDNCDFRPANSILPAPPLRSTALNLRNKVNSARPHSNKGMTGGIIQKSYSDDSSTLEGTVDDQDSIGNNN